MVRNTSEVIGVFAEVTTRRGAWLEGYRSSVDVRNLAGMEAQLSRLMSPAWPAWLPAPDDDKVGEGRALFESREKYPKSCRDCHAHLGRQDLTSRITAVMTPVWGEGGLGTDPWMMCNAFSYQALGGNLEGTRDAIIFGKRLPAMSFTRSYLGTQAIGVLLRNKFKLLWMVAKTAITGRPPEIEVFEPQAGVQTPQEQPRRPDQRLELCKTAAAAAGGGPGGHGEGRRSKDPRL